MATAGELPLDPVSQIKRVKHVGSETEQTLLAACDRLSTRTGPDGQLIVELFRHDARDRVVESFKLILCGEDRDRVVAAARR